MDTLYIKFFSSLFKILLIDSIIVLLIGFFGLSFILFLLNTAIKEFKKKSKED